MAMEAARALKGDFDDVLFASTSSPFKIKQATSFIASALDLDDVFTMDFSGSLRASTMRS
jgi:3-hydroxy-3-methylglutaryl CoA synthase